MSKLYKSISPNTPLEHGVLSAPLTLAQLLSGMLNVLVSLKASSSKWNSLLELVILIPLIPFAFFVKKERRLIVILL